MSSAGAHARERSWVALVWVAIALHALLTLRLALARYASVHNHTFDLALYARMAWGLAHGQLDEPILGGSFWGGHLSFVLWLLGWLGRASGNTAAVLLCAQSAAIALAAWPVFRCARRKLGAGAGAACAVAFLLYPNLGHVASYEFHPGSLALWPLCAALDALDKQQSRALGLASVWAVACRASLALQTLLLGVLACRSAPLRRTGLWLVAGSLAYFVLWMFWLQPRFGLAPGGSADQHYGQWGGSPLGVLRALATEPGLVFAHFGAIERLRYPLLVLLPFALLPLIAPRYLLIALPPLALNLLSRFPTASTLYSHYLTPALPGLAFAAIEGLGALRTRWPARHAPALGVAALLVASVGSNVIAGGLPWSLDYARRDYRDDRTSADRRAALRAIGPDASVQAPDALLPHLAQRARVHRVPPPDRGAEFVVLDVSHRVRYARREDLLRTLEEPLLRAWLARDDYGIAAANDALLVLQRGLPARGGLARRYFAGVAPADTGRALTECLALRGARIGTRTLTLELVARAVCPPDLAIRLGADDVPARVDLLFDGLLSPAQLSRGDVLHSTHALSEAEQRAILRRGLRVGALRASGARPLPSDPLVIDAALRERE